ncbi:MAG: UDP-N-acetylmuramoyl-L-alanine--D-glutamate ligase [Ignavibacteria bacterium]|nr:UDP-N-acetylmuramoyl-L-alanine--D-glutamate ligase [Ignavibacteria bacterium]
MRVDTGKYKKFSVIGAARSGTEVAKLLKRKGYEVFISDGGHPSEFFQQEINENEISYEYGGHSDKVFDADAVVVSPGVSSKSQLIKEARSRNIEIFSEIEISYWFSQGRVIAITGTNGKTTTTSLTGKIFEDAGFKTFVCGNIGLPFASVADKTDNDSVTVLETSSFQLENIKYFKPMISVYLNLTPDHLDRYDSLEEYGKVKMRITENQDAEDHFVYNYDDPFIRENARPLKPSKAAFSLNGSVKSAESKGAYLDKNELIYFYHKGEEIVADTRTMIIRGPHNAYNAMASLISAKILDVPNQSIKNSLETFPGVEHRLEFVKEINGIKFYNDSKATNVNSVWFALQGFSEKIILILGGRDKGNDYDEIREIVLKKVKHIVAMGESRKKILNYFNGLVSVSEAADFEDAVYKAAAEASRGDVVLLSPACSSFDMFENYEERGREFKKIVNQL